MFSALTPLTQLRCIQHTLYNPIYIESSTYTCLPIELNRFSLLFKKGLKIFEIAHPSLKITLGLHYLFIRISFKSDTMSSCLQGAGNCLELRDKPVRVRSTFQVLCLITYMHLGLININCSSNRTSLNWRNCHQSFVMESAQKLEKNEKICEDVHFNKKLHLFVSLTIPRHYSYKNYNWVLVIITTIQRVNRI